MVTGREQTMVCGVCGWAAQPGHVCNPARSAPMSKGREHTPWPPDPDSPVCSHVPPCALPPREGEPPEGRKATDNVYVRGLLTGVGPGAMLGLAGIGVRQDWELWRVIACVLLAVVLLVVGLRAECASARETR